MVGDKQGKPKPYILFAPVLCPAPDADELSSPLYAHYVEFKKHFTILSFAKLIEYDLDTRLRIKVLIFNDRTELTQDELNLVPNLDAVIMICRGFDNINFELLRKNGVQLVSNGYAFGESVAEFAILLMLASARHFVKDVNSYKSSGVGACREMKIKNLGSELNGTTVGIVGLGDIGMRLAKKLKGFNVNLIYCNQHRRTKEEEDSVHAKFCPNTIEICEKADFVVLIVPGNEHNKNLFGKTELDYMKPNAILINIARGTVINHEDLVVALTNQQIAGAALDVTDPEPLPKNHELRSFPNVTLTPHVAWCTADAIHRSVKNNLKSARAILAGLPTSHLEPGDFNTSGTKL